MRKLRLDLDDLKVEEFTTTDNAEACGTVRGNDQSYTNCFCPQTYQDLGCQTISEVDDDCFCQVHTKINEYTCYPGCI